MGASGVTVSELEWQVSCPLLEIISSLARLPLLFWPFEEMNPIEASDGLYDNVWESNWAGMVAVGEV